MCCAAPAAPSCWYATDPVPLFTALDVLVIAEPSCRCIARLCSRFSSAFPSAAEPKLLSQSCSPICLLCQLPQPIAQDLILNLILTLAFSI